MAYLGQIDYSDPDWLEKEIARQELERAQRKPMFSGLADTAAAVYVAGAVVLFWVISQTSK
ncbi:MAG: hypothetical protein GY950_00750 [bacterium]|nr:hypothetical protein [bacterium]